MFFNAFFYKSDKNVFLVLFYLQINVFNIYGYNDTLWASWNAVISILRPNKSDQFRSQLDILQQQL